MDVQQNAMNQAAIAREQINEQIKTHRKLLEQARQQVQELVDVQITTAKEEHRKLAAQAAEEAAQAKKAAQGQTATTNTNAPTQLAQLIIMLSEGTGADREQVAKQSQEATEAAIRIVKKVSQVFNSPADDGNQDLDDDPQM